MAFYRDDVGIRPVLPEATTDIPGDLTGVDGRARRRRALHRKDGARCTERPRGLRQGEMRAAGGDGRPWAPGASDPSRLRRQEPSRRGSTSRWTSQSTGSVLGDVVPRDEHTFGAGRGSGWPDHLLSVADLDAETIGGILRVADAFAEVARRPIPKVPTLRGKTVATLFVEESTRTRLSFETAARRLSADVMSLSTATSSIKKGESLRDTALTLAAMGVDALVVRHPSAGAPTSGGQVSSTPR